MRYNLLIFFTYSIALFGEQNPITKDFPTSTKEIVDFTNLALKKFDDQFLEFKNQSLKDLDYATTVIKWGNIIEPLFTKAITLSFLPLIVSDLETLQNAKIELHQIEKKIATAMNDPKALALFIDFIKNPKNQKAMTPYQIYSITQILQNIESPNLKKEVSSIKNILSSYKMEPFMYAKGDLPEKSLPKNHEITLLSWNVCMLEAPNSMLFGGVLPWKERIQRIATKIELLNPDILCLQEVFSQHTGDILVQKLKSQYSHFYYNMGPNPPGFSVKTLGLPSGLFVASKYPLKEEKFTPYAKDEIPDYRSYGFFTATIYNNEKPLARFLTTHLQPGDEAEDKAYRALETKAILNSLEKKDLITFLCGDFNIIKNSKEALEMFTSFEASPYQGLDWTCSELRDYWWKAKQDIKAFKALPPEKEWLDYFFYLKNSSKNPPKLFTTLVTVNDPDHPEEALSDHQLLFTSITFNKDSSPELIKEKAPN